VLGGREGENSTRYCPSYFLQAGIVFTGPPGPSVPGFQAQKNRKFPGCGFARLAEFSRSQNNSKVGIKFMSSGKVPWPNIWLQATQCRDSAPQRLSSSVLCGIGRLSPNVRRQDELTAVMTMVNRQDVSRDWAARGFSCDLWVDSPGQRWEGFVHTTDELVLVLEGELEFEVNGVISHPKIGEELYIPAGAVHSVRNIGSQTARWLYGYR